MSVQDGGYHYSPSDSDFNFSMVKDNTLEKKAIFGCMPIDIRDISNYTDSISFLERNISADGTINMHFNATIQGMAKIISFKEDDAGLLHFKPSLDQLD